MTCPASNPFNVFGVPSKPCCYKYHKYCEEVRDCEWKRQQKQLEIAKQGLTDILHEGEEYGTSYTAWKTLQEIRKEN